MTCLFFVYPTDQIILGKIIPKSQSECGVFLKIPYKRIPKIIRAAFQLPCFMFERFSHTHLKAIKKFKEKND